MSIEVKVKEVIAEALYVNMSAIHNKTSLEKELDMDSLDAVNLIMSLEEAFNLEIPEDKAVQFRKVQDIIAYISEKSPQSSLSYS